MNINSKRNNTNNTSKHTKQMNINKNIHAEDTPNQTTPHNANTHTIYVTDTINYKIEHTHKQTQQ